MLINCVAYQDGKRLAEIQPQEIHRYLAMPNCFVWVALLDRDDGSLELMQAEFDLHPLAVEDAKHGHQRPKIEEYDDSAVRGPAPARAGERRLARRRGQRVRRPQLRADDPQPCRAGLRGRARTLRARAGTAEERLRLRALRTDRCGRRSLLPAARCHRNRAGRHRGPDLRRHFATGERRGALLR